MTSAPWRPDPADLADFLRRRGLRVGIGEMLRALGMLDRLAALGRAPATPREAARFLSPLLCSSLRHQEALPGWLEEFDLERLPPPPPQPPEQPQSPKPIFVRIAVAIVLALVLLAMSLLLINRVEPDNTGKRATVLATLTEIVSGWRGLLSVIPLLMIPPLLTAAILFWRGRRLPVMQRGPYAGEKLSRMRTGGAGEVGLFAGETVRDAIRKLRSHRRIVSRRIDPNATVRATVRRAGHPALVRAQSFRAPEYPVLVHTISDRDHLVFFAESLCARLNEEGVHHALYHFSADPRFVWDASGATNSLTDLAARFGADVLLLVGDGSPFIDPVTLKLYSWTEAFAEWRVTVLLTPLPQARWSWRERRLAEGGIVVLPATSKGLVDLGAFVASGGRPPRLPLQRRPAAAGLLTLEGIHAHRFHSDAIRNPAESEEILDAIVQDVPRPAIEVLAIASLFPEARPDLTHYLGQNVKPSLGATFDEEGFGALCTLPWLRYGRLPDWLRLALVKTLGPEREAEGRRLLPAWVGSEPDAAGVALAGDSGSRPAAEEDIQDVIYLRFVRHEPLGTLELRAPDDLERLAGSQPFPRRWRIAAYVAVADAALVASALLTPITSLVYGWLPSWSVDAGILAVGLSVIFATARLLTASCTFDRNFGLLSLLLDAVGLMLIAPTSIAQPGAERALVLLSISILAPLFCFIRKDGAFVRTTPPLCGISPALAVLWLLLLPSVAEILPSLKAAYSSTHFALALGLAALNAVVAISCSKVAPSGSWVKQSLASVAGLIFGVHVGLWLLGLSFAFGIDSAKLVDSITLPLLSVFPLLCCFVATTGRIGPAARRPLVIALGCVIQGTLAIMFGRSWVDSVAVDVAGIAISTIAFVVLASFSIRANRTVFIKAVAAIVIIVALLMATAFVPDALHPLALVVGVAGMYLLLRTRPGPEALATFVMWFVTLDWYQGWLAPTGLGLVLQPLYLVAATACGIRFGMRGLSTVLLGGLPLMLYLDVPFWELHCRGNIDLQLAGLFAFVAATSVDRPRWRLMLQRSGLPALALAAVLPAIGALAVASRLIDFVDLQGAFPAIFVFMHAGLMLLVAVTSGDVRRWLFVAVPGPVAVALAVALLRQAVPAGPDWSIPALLLAPFWLLIAGSMLAASLLREPTPVTMTAVLIYLAELAVIVVLVRTGAVTSSAMFALIGALAIDMARRPRSGGQAVWAGWAIPDGGGVANALLVGLCIAFLSGLRWEGAAAFAIVLLAALPTSRAAMPTPMTAGRSAFERSVVLGAALLPSALAGRFAATNTPLSRTS